MILGNELVLDVDLAREEHVRVARRLVAEHPDVGAIVLECTNMPPYTADIQRETGRPCSTSSRSYDGPRRRSPPAARRARPDGRPPGQAARSL